MINAILERKLSFEQMSSFERLKITRNFEITVFVARDKYVVVVRRDCCQSRYLRLRPLLLSVIFLNITVYYLFSFLMMHLEILEAFNYFYLVSYLHVYFTFCSGPFQTDSIDVALSLSLIVVEVQIIATI